MPITQRILVLANVTAASDELCAKLTERAGRAPSAFTLVVPASRASDARAVAEATVARAVQRRMLATGSASVALDMRAVDPALFPNVVSALRRAGIDPERELVPVAPAAHYMMGGICTDLEARASVAGLYAVGECSCTGLHGANRLASNSLTECFVFGARAARAALHEPRPQPAQQAEGLSSLPAPKLAPASRAALWQSGGLERDAAGLQALNEDPHPLVRLIARCALERTESRGAHQRRDHPAVDRAFDEAHVTVAATGAVAREHWD